MSESSPLNTFYDIISIGMLGLSVLVIVLVTILMVQVPPGGTVEQPTPTLFVIPTETPTLIGPTPDPTTTPAPATANPTITSTVQDEVLQYVRRSETPFFEENPGVAGGCDVGVISGEVYDENEEHVTGVRVIVTGPDGFREETTTGSAVVTLGASGWEVILEDGPTVDRFSVQLVDASGNPLSREVLFNMRNDCELNRAVIIFDEQ